MLKPALSSPRARLLVGVCVVAAFTALPALAESPNSFHRIPALPDPSRAQADVVAAAAPAVTVSPAAAAVTSAPASTSPAPSSRRAVRPFESVAVAQHVTPRKAAPRKPARHKPVPRKPARHKPVPRKPARHKAAPHKAAPHKAAPHKAAPKAPARNGYNTTTVGHYIRSLRGTARDARIMATIGAQDAARNPSHGRYIVLLDIGGQTRRGVRLSTTTHVVSYGALVNAMRGYLAGYHQRQHGDAPVTIAIGTNNDLWVDDVAGRVWATQMINPVAKIARRYPGIVIAGASDIEPGFAGSAKYTRAWLAGYLHHTSAPFVFNGSADGCSAKRPNSRCNAGWTSHDLVQLAGTISPARTTVVPQIYNHAMVGQWTQLAREAQLRHGRLNIAGPLTENRACGHDPTCPTMPTRAAWSALFTSLHRAHLVSRPLPVSVDLDVR